MPVAPGSAVEALRSGALTWVGCLALAGLLSACGDSLPTGPVDVVPTEGLQGFEASLDSVRVALRIPWLAAAIALDDRIVWSRGFGYADVEAGIPASDTTAFYLASVTKPIGAIVR
jgi:CubicO group peptidase (beta-lactamase class C family)